MPTGHPSLLRSSPTPTSPRKRPLWAARPPRLSPRKSRNRRHTRRRQATSGCRKKSGVLKRGSCMLAPRCLFKVYPRSIFFLQMKTSLRIYLSSSKFISFFITVHWPKPAALFDLLLLHPTAKPKRNGRSSKRSGRSGERIARTASGPNQRSSAVARS